MDNKPKEAEGGSSFRLFIILIVIAVIVAAYLLFFNDNSATTDEPSPQFIPEDSTEVPNPIEGAYDNPFD